MVMHWHRGPGLYEAESGNLTVDFCDDAFVFFRFNAACAVDEAAAGFQELNRCLDDPPLKVLHPGKVLRGQAPSNIGASPDDPGVGAWNIHQNGIEGFRLKRR